MRARTSLIHPALALTILSILVAISAEAKPSPNLCICIYEDQEQAHHRAGCEQWLKDNRANCNSAIQMGKSEDFKSVLSESGVTQGTYSNVLIYGSYHGKSAYIDPIFRMIDEASDSLNFVHLYFDSFACNIFNDVSEGLVRAEELKARFPDRSFSIQGNQNLGIAGYGAGTPLWRYYESQLASSKVRFEISPESRSVEVRYAPCSLPRNPCGAMNAKERAKVIAEHHSDPNTKTCSLPSGELTTQECCASWLNFAGGIWSKPGQACRGQ